MDWKPYFHVDPYVCKGRTCISGTRITVSSVLDKLADGMSVEAIVASSQKNPTSKAELTLKDVHACMAYAVKVAHDELKRNSISPNSQGEKRNKTILTTSTTLEKKPSKPKKTNEASPSPSLKEKSSQSEKLRNISGIWVCQYIYPKTNERLGIVEDEIETQVVRFEQTGNLVKGSTMFAVAHPEDFQGQIINRYFTGLYFNQKNHHSYHGAFQFVLSNSKNRMLGKWVGFNREGNGVDSEEWRWEQVNDNPDISDETAHKYKADAINSRLFEIKKFL